MFAVSLVLVAIKLLKALWTGTHHHKRLLEKLCGEVLCIHTWESNVVAAWGKKSLVLGGRSVESFWLYELRHYVHDYFTVKIITYCASDNLNVFVVKVPPSFFQNAIKKDYRTDYFGSFYTYNDLSLKPAVAKLVWCKFCGVWTDSNVSKVNFAIYLLFNTS